MAQELESAEELAQPVTNLMFEYQQFYDLVANFFRDYPDLKEGSLPPVHSVKSRIKSHQSIVDKIDRKKRKGKIITRDNVFDELTDVLGVRVLHLHTRQFEVIYSVIMDRVANGKWYLFETPIAYTWDPELKKYFSKFEINAQEKDIYTSVHFVVVDPTDERIKCEIQVRTLFDEIWGEIDHTLNYPYVTDNVHCYEQLRVLARLATTGTRLTDSIFRSHKEI